MNSTRPISDKATWGNDSLGPQEHIILYFAQSIEPVVLPLAAQIVLGRTSEDYAVEVDLTPYGAAEQGVSRSHAAIDIQPDCVTLTDLDSTNGTFLNNQPLPPQQPVTIRSGDQIRLGELVGYIYFSRAIPDSDLS